MGRWHSNETPLERHHATEWADCVEDFGVEIAKKKMPEKLDVGFMTELLIASVKHGIATREEFCVRSWGLAVHRRFTALGRPTYLVSKEVYEIASELEVSADDYAHVFEKLPYPCFAFCFERGAAYTEQAEVQSVFIMSGFTQKDIFGFDLNIPFGEGFSRTPSCLIINVDQKYEHGLIGDLTAPPMDDKNLEQMRRAIVGLMMLWRSRPEFIVPAKLTKSERYPEFKNGDLKQIRMWKFPDKLIVRKPSVQAAPTGRHVKAHWRAGHFRHYRNERYEREPDGSVKVEFILPCMVHADELVEAAGNGPQANG